MSGRYSDKSNARELELAQKMDEAVAKFAGRITVCKPAMPNKKRNPVGGR